jgi:hypothetical protein
MENATMTGRDVLAKVVLEATQPGEMAEPAGLLSEIASSEKPLNDLNDLNRGNDLFEALHQEFSFIRLFLNAGIVPHSSDLSRWASLLRWFMAELRQWREQEDPTAGKIAALFVVALSSDRVGRFWDLLPDGLHASTELIDFLSGLIGKFRVEFSTLPGITPLIREQEAIEKFKQADAHADWRVIGEIWPLFNPVFSSAVTEIQTIRCLYHFRFDVLISSLILLNQTAVGMRLAGALSDDKRLKVAVASDNPYVQFCSVFQTVSVRPRTQALPTEAQELLTDLLVKVAADEPRWAAWMHVFNTYPVRVPALQIPLGRALASGPEPAIGPYVNAMHLFGKPVNSPFPDSGRREITECLAAFRQTASEQRRIVLWKLAHERWLEWNFDEKNETSHLTTINRCDLDYAIVGYACECMDEASREAVIESIVREALAINLSWHPSVVHLIATWNRLLSKLQPFVYARQVTSVGDWLPKANQVSLPFDPTKEPYNAMKYKVA